MFLLKSQWYANWLRLYDVLSRIKTSIVLDTLERVVSSQDGRRNVFSDQTTQK